MEVNKIVESSYKDTVEVVSAEDNVATLFGISVYSITKKQLKEIMNGKYIYCENGEYASLFCLS